MSNFNRSFNRPTRDREMHRTTCSNCGRECQVPFKPNGSKPVFCSDCFDRNGGETRRSNDRDYAAPRRSNFDDRRPSFNENRSYDRPQNFDRPQQNNNDQFAALNSKLDRIITLLMSKPEYKGESAESTSESEESASAVEKKTKSSRKPKATTSEAVE